MTADALNNLAATNKEKQKFGILSFVTAVVVILNSGYYLSTIRDSYIPLILLMVLTVFLLLYKFFIGTRIDLRFDIFAALFLILTIGFSVLMNFSSSNLLSGGRVAVTLFCTCMIARLTDNGQVFRYYCSIIKYLIVASTLFYLITQFLNLSFLPTLTSNGARFYNLLILAHRANASRIIGAFWEPGVFASHIIIASLIEIYFIKKKTGVVSVLLYVLGIIMTRSTAGALIMFIVGLGFLVKRSKLGKYRSAQVLFFALVIVGILTYDSLFEWLASLNPGLFSKLIETTSSTNYTRMNAPLVNLEIFAKKPLFGWGFTDAATQFASYLGHKLVAQTSTSTQIMASVGIGGIMYSILFIRPLFSKKALSHLALIDKFIIIASMLLIVNKEPHIYFAITWMILFIMNNLSGSSESETASDTECVPAEDTAEVDSAAVTSRGGNDL